MGYIPPPMTSEWHSLVRQISKDFLLALAFVTFLSYALGIMVGVSVGRSRCAECGKSLQSERPGETEARP